MNRVTAVALAVADQDFQIEFLTKQGGVQGSVEEKIARKLSTVFFFNPRAITPINPEPWL